MRAAIGIVIPEKIADIAAIADIADIGNAEPRTRFGGAVPTLKE